MLQQNVNTLGACACKILIAETVRELKIESLNRFKTDKVE